MKLLKQLLFLVLFVGTAFGQTQWITSYNSYETMPGSSGLQSGHGFVVPSIHDLPITALCRRVESGNTQTHTVQLYTPTHQAIPNTSVSVPTAGHTAGSWSCVDLATPYRTEAGLRYAVLSNENGPDQVSCGHITTTVSATSAGWAWYEPGEDFWIDEPGDSCGTSMIHGAALTPGLRIVSQAAPTGAVGSAVGFDFVASGGAGSYQWSIISGALPAGLSLASGGRLSGTPSTVQTVTYTIQVKDSANDTASRALTQTILPAAGPTESDNRYCSISGQWLGAATDQTVQLPQRCVYSARNATPSPGTVRFVAPGSSILTTVNAASCGDIIELQHGGTYGQISGLPNKNCDDAHWITIRSDAYQQLPPEGTRISPCYAGVSTLPGRPPYSCPSGGAQNLMAKIETRFNYDEAIRFAAGANHYRLIGLEVTRQQGTGLAPVYGLLYFADNANKIIMDQMWIHGLDITVGNETVYAFSFGRTNAVAVVDSYFNNFFCLQGIGTCTDGSAIGGALGTSDSWGNWKIVNNYIEGGGENMLFGGGGGSGPPPLDIEIRRNYLYKPLTWNRVMPQFTPYQGNGPQIKNLFELKRAGRLLFEGNILENNWPASDQGGQAVLYTAANQSDDQTTAMCPDCKVYDVVDRFNFITQAAGAIQMANVTYCSGHPSCTPAQLYSLSIHDNLYSHLRGDISCSGQWGGACINAFLPQVIDGRTTNFGNIFYNHITMVYERIPNMLGYYDGPCNASHFTLKNSIIPAGLWGYGGGCGSGPSTPRMTGGFPGTATFRNNMLVAATVDTGTWTDLGGTSNTLQRPANFAAVGFTNMAGDDYSLTSASTGHNAGDDSKDIGVDIAGPNGLNAHIAGVRTGTGVEIPPAEIFVSVNPPTATVLSQATHQFTATVHNHSNQSVTWSVPSGQGSISGSGLFTAPAVVRRHPEITGGRGSQTGGFLGPRATNVTITATSVQDPTKSGTALVTVNPTALPIDVSVSPTNPSITSQGTQTFTAIVTNATNPGVNWSVQSGGGSVSPSTGTTTTYTAPTGPASAVVRATSQEDTSKYAEATVTVNSPVAPPAVSITIAPTSQTLQTGATQVFNATVLNGGGNANANFSVLSGGGSVSPSSGTSTTYTAPGTAGSATVRATAQADTSKTADAAVTVNAPVGGVQVSLAPIRPALFSNSSQQFNPTVTGTSNTAVNWSISPSSQGTINSSGFYTAPTVSAATLVTVTATSQADSSRSASSAVTVVPSPPIGQPCHRRFFPYSASWSAANQEVILNVNNTIPLGGTINVTGLPAAYNGTFIVNGAAATYVRYDSISANPGAFAPGGIINYDSPQCSAPPEDLPIVNWMTGYAMLGNPIAITAGTWRGNNIIANRTFTIQALCRWTLAGNTSSHAGGIFTISGTKLDSVTIPAGTANSWSCGDMFPPYQVNSGAQIAIAVYEEPPDLRPQCGFSTFTGTNIVRWMGGTTTTAGSSGPTGNITWLETTTPTPCGASFLYKEGSLTRGSAKKPQAQKRTRPATQTQPGSR